MKRICSLLLTVAVLLSLCTTAFAADFTDVPADAWYADAVNYVQEHDLMTGTGGTEFSPNSTMTRAMLATVLYRVAGNPTVSGNDAFTDTSDNAWYSKGVLWASQQGLVDGYGNGLFGTNDPVSREQIAAILWRYAGRPVAENGTGFADESTIASYAMTAVDWAKANGIISGVGGNRFAPKNSATRAQVAAILHRYLTMDDTTEPTTSPSEADDNGGSTMNPPTQSDTPTAPDPTGGKTLVVYFSATGSTERVAEYIANAMNADTFELTPVQPYTSSDLNYNNDSSRVSREHNDPSLQNVELTATTVDNWSEYDTVFIGYPIWWHAAAWPVNSFITGNDFTGKTVVPFCTSASSGLEGSDEKLKDMAGTGNWLPGERFSSGASEATVLNWVNGLDIPKPAEQRALVAYFSRTGENYSVGVIEKGNTHIVADMIAEQTGADLFEIATVTPYPSGYEDCKTVAQREQNSNARPELNATVSMADYDVIFVGYPIWYGDMPMAVYTFLESYDFTGKTIIPFCTHAGSGLSGTVSSIRSACTGATVLDGLAVAGTTAQNNQTAARQSVNNWLDALDY